MNDYQQSSIVSQFHAVRRFGHSNRLASLASWEEEQRRDYVNGIVSFSILLFMIALVWIVVLLVLKLSFGPSVVGCASGGAPVDVSELRRQHVRRSIRKQQIIRNWRVQAVFVILAFFVPTLSFLMVNHGWIPFTESLEQVVDVSLHVQAKADEGVRIATNLTGSRYRIMRLVESVNIPVHCPNFKSSQMADAFTQLNRTMHDGMQQIDDFVEQYVVSLASGLAQAEGVSIYVQDTVAKVDSYNWLVEGFLIALNLINLLLILGALLSRNSVYWPCYHHLLAYFVVPSFALLLVGTITATFVSASIALVNADYCAGGLAPGSPQGTVEDILSAKGYNATEMPYEAAKYYSSDCNGSNPFSFVHNFRSALEEHNSYVQNSLVSLSDYDIDVLSEECGADMQPMTENLYELAGQLDKLEDVLNAAVNLTACESLEPIIGRLTDDTFCTESVQGLGWLFGTTLGLALVSLSILSTRAALYNAVLKPRRLKRREREFREYKEYMQQFYDTSGWLVDPPPATDKPDAIERADTVETSSDCSPCQEGFSSVDAFEQAATVPLSPATTVVRIKVAATNLTKQTVAAFHSDNAIEYYSSDSEDDAEPTDSSVGPSGSVISSVSGLVSRLKTRHPDRELPESPTQRRRIPLNAWALPSGLWTPRTERRSEQHNWQIQCRESSLSSEQDTLTPSPSGKAASLQAPRKSRRSKRRTHGAAKLDEV